MRTQILVVGSGLLANLVTKLLPESTRIVRFDSLEDEFSSNFDMALVVDDGWNPRLNQRAEDVLRRRGTPWLRGFVFFGTGMIGPLVLPDAPGCSECADMRFLIAGENRQEAWELKQQQLQENARQQPDSWASRNGLYQLAWLLVGETEQILRGQSGLTEHILAVNLKTFRTTRHHFIPEPLCPICGAVADDSPEAATISLQSSPKISPDSFRCRPMNELQDGLSQDYMNPKTGIFNRKLHILDTPFAAVSVNLPMFSGNELTAGRTLSYADSELTAILEGLERHCGMEPRGTRPVVHASFRSLGNQVMNPLDVGVHDSERYQDPEFPFQQFDPERPMSWVWGYSFLRQRPLLVPERLAYYSVGGNDAYIYETSNGCALGGTLEEAIFYGILEIVERDAFLITWYAQLPVPRLDPLSSDDPELTLMIQRIQAVTGYDIHLFNTTMENGIPSVWILAKNRGKTGPNLVCSAGSHLDPVRAAKSAVHELAASLRVEDERFEAHKEDYLKMVHDPFQVRQMEDHGMLYGLPETEERLRFLLDEKRPARKFQEEFSSTKQHADLTDDLRDLLDIFRSLNLDVIVVNQTTTELQRHDLHCVKVVIPGMLPMTFGHHLIRLQGLDRVLTVPMELGYAQHPLTATELNPHPHPFP